MAGRESPWLVGSPASTNHLQGVSLRVCTHQLTIVVRDPSLEALVARYLGFAGIGDNVDNGNPIEADHLPLSVILPYRPCQPSQNQQTQRGCDSHVQYLSYSRYRWSWTWIC